MRRCLFAIMTLVLTFSCDRQQKDVSFLVLDPGHFHASLVFKHNLEGVDSTIHLYAPDGAEAEQFLGYISDFEEAGTASWTVEWEAREDCLQRMISEGKGQAVVLAGNNRRKAGYILESVKAGLNVLADKPMAINSEDYDLLAEAYSLAEEKGLVIYELMTERHDILNIVEKALLNDDELFGQLQTGSPEEPAISMESIHHFYKNVSGTPLVRPEWYYDTEQQGEGIADVTTHLLDLVNWQCFPEEAVDPDEDIEVLKAEHWFTPITLAQYTQSTGAESFPDYLLKDVTDGVLNVYANGRVVYRVKGVNVEVKVIWNYEPPVGGGDCFSCVKRGEKAELREVQDAASGFIKQLYIEDLGTNPDFEARLDATLGKLSTDYPFLQAVDQGGGLYLIDIPVEKRLGHETHFSKVASAFLSYLRGAELPSWEYSNSLAKYRVTTKAVEIASE